MKVKPLFRWVGGKRHHAEAVIATFPAGFTRYHEPFAGGAAVFFELINQGWDGTATLSDSNPDVANALFCVQQDPHGVIEWLRVYREHQDLVGYVLAYERIAAKKPFALTQVERAARFLYLLKKCYGGVYRVNKSGKYNVPLAVENEHRWYDPEDILRVSRALDGHIIRHDDFRDRAAVWPSDACDVVYCDPPYFGSWGEYEKNGFDGKDHIELAIQCNTWADCGVHVTATNADHRVVRTLYERFAIRELAGRKNVRHSQPTTELLIWTL